jgi:hypothetical protein
MLRRNCAENSGLRDHSIVAVFSVMYRMYVGYAVRGCAPVSLQQVPSAAVRDDIYGGAKSGIENTHQKKAGLGTGKGLMAESNEALELASEWSVEPNEVLNIPTVE